MDKCQKDIYTWCVYTHCKYMQEGELREKIQKLTGEGEDQRNECKNERVVGLTFLDSS